MVNQTASEINFLSSLARAKAKALRIELNPELTLDCNDVGSLEFFVEPSGDLLLTDDVTIPLSPMFLSSDELSAARFNSYINARAAESISTN